MQKPGGTLPVSRVDGISNGDAAPPVLAPGGEVVIVAIGGTEWVWDVNRGKDMANVVGSLESAGVRTTGLSRGRRL